MSIWDNVIDAGLHYPKPSDVLLKCQSLNSEFIAYSGSTTTALFQLNYPFIFTFNSIEFEYDLQSNSRRFLW